MRKRGFARNLDTPDSLASVSMELQSAAEIIVIKDCPAFSPLIFFTNSSPSMFGEFGINF
jgi:hypothetical protein